IGIVKARPLAGHKRSARGFVVPGSAVNFRVGTLSTKQRVSSRWSNAGPLKNASAKFNCSLSKCKQQQKTRQKREVGTSASVNFWGGLFRRRTISSLIGTRVQTSLIQMADYGRENRHYPRTAARMRASI